MAEVAGLALSGVALVSLFSSCIEFLDYLDQSKNCARDVQVTLTKLGLLKQRLHAWGESISIQSLEDDIGSQYRAAEEHSLIAQSLVGIRNILTATSTLYDKYGCGRLEARSQSPRCPNAPLHATGANGANAPHKAADAQYQSPTLVRDWSWDSSDTITSGCLGLQGDDSTTTTTTSFRLNGTPRSERDEHKRTASQARLAFQAIRLKIIWLLSDRKKFNALLADLDFLLNSLERLAEHSPMAPIAKLPQTLDQKDLEKDIVRGKALVDHGFRRS